jgi:tryptophan synthase beta subunit
MECTIYMGAVDCERQKLNVFRMQVKGCCGAAMFCFVGLLCSAL